VEQKCIKRKRSVITSMAKIKCQICNMICGSLQEYNLHCKTIHGSRPLKKEKLREMVLIE